MFNLLPYLWMTFILAVVALPIIAGLMGRPKRQPKAAAPEEVQDGLPPEASLDFADEMSQANN